MYKKEKVTITLLKGLKNALKRRADKEVTSVNALIHGLLMSMFSTEEREQILADSEESADEY